MNRHRPLLLVAVLCAWTLPPARAQSESSSTAARPADGIIPPPSEIQRDRPRLLLRPRQTPNAVSLDELRSRPRDGAEAAALLNQLKRQQSAAAQALVWLMTGDTSAADRALRRLREYRYPGKVDTFHIYFRLTEFALAYDWLYGYAPFTDAIKREVREGVAPLVAQGLRATNDHLFHNYVWMSAGGVAMWALATAGEDPGSDHALEIIRRHFNDRLFPALEYLDALPSEPMGYWALYVFTPGLQALVAAQSAFDADLVGAVRTRHGDWANRNLRTLIHGTLPDMRYIPWGDLQGGPNGGVTLDMAGTIDAATWALRSREGLALGHWLASRRGPARFRADTAIFYFLYTPALGARVGADPAWPELSLLAGNSKGGHFIARSDWGDEATVVGFRCADHFGDHNHFDQGSFLIYRRGLLAVDPPVYKETRGPQQKTGYHNTLLIGGRPQRRVSGQTFPTLAEFRRNLRTGRRLETGDILFHREVGGWAAVSGQFAQAYDDPLLQSCVRQLLYIRPGTVVVVDQLAAAPDRHLPEIQWLLQLPARPEEREGALAVTNGASFLRCRAILPAGTKPALEETPMRTVRARYAYPGGATVILVHVLEVGDAARVTRVTEAAAVVREGAVEVSIDRRLFRFSTRPPFGVE